MFLYVDVWLTLWGLCSSSSRQSLAKTIVSDGWSLVPSRTPSLSRLWALLYHYLSQFPHDTHAQPIHNINRQSPWSSIHPISSDTNHTQHQQTISLKQYPPYYVIRHNWYTTSTDNLHEAASTLYHQTQLIHNINNLHEAASHRISSHTTDTQHQQSPWSSIHPTMSSDTTDTQHQQIISMKQHPPYIIIHNWYTTSTNNLPEAVSIYIIRHNINIQSPSSSIHPILSDTTSTYNLHEAASTLYHQTQHQQTISIKQHPHYIIRLENRKQPTRAFSRVKGKTPLLNVKPPLICTIRTTSRTFYL